MKRVLIVTLMMAFAVATITSCSDKVEAIKGVLEGIELSPESDSETGEPSFSSSVKGLAADGESKIIVAIAADASNPATDITITSDVDWGTVGGDETIYAINGESYYIFSLTSEESLPTALDAAAVATINYTIEAKFSDGSEKSATKSIEVVRPPVIFAHGLASGPETFDPMLEYIRPMGLYVDSALYALDYKATSLASYQTNNRVVPEAIDATFAAMLRAGYVASKATLVGHSMGGILTRIYLQDGVFNDDGVSQKEPYRGDILKIITIDTPHSGSQLADFALTLGDNHSILSIFSKMGAIVDLAVESEATADLNSAEKLSVGNALKVPTHLITAEIGTLSGIVELVSDEQYAIAVLSFLLDAVGSKLVYGDDTSDVVVPMLSQMGGVESSLLKKYITTYTNEWHCSVHMTEQAATDIVELLNTVSSDSKTFTTAGFAPDVLSYNNDILDDSIYVQQAVEIPFDGILNEFVAYLDSDDNIIAVQYEGVEMGDASDAAAMIEIVRVESDDDVPHILYMRTEL